VIQDGVNGFVSCDLDYLIDRMRFLLDHPAEAARIGAAARRTAEERFGLDRFRRDWNAAFARVLGETPLTSLPPSPLVGEGGDNGTRNTQYAPRPAEDQGRTVP